MGTKARELQSDPRKAKAAPPLRAGRVRHDTLWAEAHRRFEAARAEGRHVRVWIETEG